MVSLFNDIRHTGLELVSSNTLSSFLTWLEVQSIQSTHVIPANAGIQYKIRAVTFFSFGFASMASYFLLLTPQEVTKKEGAPISCPQIKTWGYPHSFMIF